MKTFLRSTCFLVLLLFCSVNLSYGQTMGAQTIEQLRGSPAGSKIILLLDLIAADKILARESIAPFSQSWNEKLPALNDSLKGIRAKYGSFILYTVNRIAISEFELLVKATQGSDWLQLKLNLQGGPPFGIERYAIEKVNAPGIASSPLYMPNGGKEDASVSVNINEQALGELDADMKALLKNEAFSGVLLIADNWKPVFNNVYGFSNIEKKIDNDTDTRFNIGSVNKLFTGISILQLVQQEKLSLEDKVINYLPGLSHPDASKITIAQLLQHRSGYGMYWNDTFFLNNLEKLKTIADYMQFLKDASIEFTPGSRQLYSNTGYILLGAVIEKITGRSYYEYIQENIFNIAGMKNSGFDTRVKNMATGYTKGFGEPKQHALTPNSGMQAIMGSPAGGGYATAQDMLLFFKTIYDCKFLNKAMTSLFTNNYNPANGELKSRTAAGGSAGLEAFCKYDLTNHLLIVALSNFDPVSAQTAVSRVENRLYKESKN
jgi:D-alanyl-D-alanine carboxypeptidase